MDAGGSGRGDVAVALDLTGLGLKTAAGSCCAMPSQEGERAKKEENRAMRGLASQRARHIVHRCKAPPRYSIDASRATRHPIREVSRLHTRPRASLTCDRWSEALL